MALLDQYGRPMLPEVMAEEVAAPTLGGVRSPHTGYPADGLTPDGLASILRAADAGDATSYLELAETIEERDLHYVGVLGTRRRSVAQLDISVEAPEGDPLGEEKARMVRRWLERDQLQDELFDILDALGKGYSMTEIIWETSARQWMPRELKYRDPRFFRFDRTALDRPMLIGEDGIEHELPGYKFIYATMKAKSGLVLRSGLARIVAWAWMFKAYTAKDWAIFTQNYGQPIRLGKFGANASEADKETLLRAVRNIAGDCAGIIPESMALEIIQSANVGASADLYQSRSEYLDLQVSKAVLGQTATTDAVTGGLGSGAEHRQVQEDIERADAKALQSVLNAQLIQPWCDLEFGPGGPYPKLKIGRPEPEDLKGLSDAIGPMIDRGLAVPAKWLRDKFGVPEAQDGEAVLGRSTPISGDGTGQAGAGAPFKRFSAVFKRSGGQSGVLAPQSAEVASPSRSGDFLSGAAWVPQFQSEVSPQIDAMIASLIEMVEAAGDIEELREMVASAYPGLDATQIRETLAAGMLAAAGMGVAMAAAGDIVVDLEGEDA